MANSSIQSEARRLEILTVIALIILIVGLMAAYVLAPVLLVVQGLDAGDRDAWSRVGPALIRALPSVLLIGAVSSARGLFGRLARNELFSEAVGRGVRGIGESLLAAAVAKAAIVPWLLAWVDGRHGFGGVDLDPLTIVLAVVGAVLLMLGRLLRRAGDLHDELEKFV
jgi:hypothetical protein